MNKPKEPKTSPVITQTLCKEVVSKIGQLCKLSNQSVDSITKDLLANDSFIETSSDTLDTIITHTPRVTFAIASVVVFGFIVQKVYLFLTPSVEPPTDESNFEDADKTEL